jgi:hypothetical protein
MSLFSLVGNVSDFQADALWWDVLLLEPCFTLLFLGVFAMKLQKCAW